jgi:hypothetical protein
MVICRNLSLTRRFLLLIYQTNFVLQSRNPVEITKRLQALPRDLTAAYEEIFQRIKPEELEFSYFILGWVFHAQRLLKMDELQHALAVEIGVPSLQHHLITDAPEIVRICGGLISLEENSDLVIFSHETVKPFIRDNKLQALPSHVVLAKTCLTYLQQPLFAPVPDVELVASEQSEYIFGKYAASFLAVHTLLAIDQSKRDAELEEGILEVFSSRSRRKMVVELHATLTGYSVWISQLGTLLKLRLSFLVVSPLATESISKMWVCFLNSANRQCIERSERKYHKR